MTTVDEPPDDTLPCLGFIAPSGSGKTTLLTRLIPVLLERGIRCAAIKYTHHDIDIDMPGKDSFRLRAAGAGQVILASPHRVGLVQEGDGHSEPRLADLIARFERASLDLVLVEGYAQAAIPKIEIHRPSLRLPLRAADDATVIALATDDVPLHATALPCLPLNAPDAIADFIVDWLSA